MQIIFYIYGKALVIYILNVENSIFKISTLMGHVLFSCTPDTIIDETSSTQPDSKNVFTKPSRQTTTFWDFIN